MSSSSPHRPDARRLLHQAAVRPPRQPGSSACPSQTMSLQAANGWENSSVSCQGEITSCREEVYFGKLQLSQSPKSTKNNGVHSIVLLHMPRWSTAALTGSSATLLLKAEAVAVGPTSADERCVSGAPGNVVLDWTSDHQTGLQSLSTAVARKGRNLFIHITSKMPCLYSTINATNAAS